MSAFFFNLMYLLPKNLLSRWVGRLVHLRLPDPLRLWSMRWFAGRYRIDLNEAEKPLEEYASIGDLFVRRLKPGLRPVDEGSFAVHPCDAMMTKNGPVEDDMLIQAKGKYYGLEEFVADGGLAKKVSGGSYFTYYLCPTDYHRVHSPVEGRVRRVLYVPGKLWPVNEWSVDNIDRLFAVNERLVVEIETEKGPVVLVMVGATNVGKMTLSFDERWVTNGPEGSPKQKDYAASVALKKGQELGIFHMGSTVIMLYPPSVSFRSADFEPRAAKLGKRLV